MAKSRISPDARDRMLSSLHFEASRLLSEVNAPRRPQAESDTQVTPSIWYWSLWNALLDAVQANRPLRATQRKALIDAAKLAVRGRGWGKEQLLQMGLDEELVPDMERLSMQFHPTFVCCALEPSWILDEEDVRRASRAWISNVDRVLREGDPLAAIEALVDVLSEGVDVLCKVERVLVGPSQLPDEQAWRYLFSSLARLARGPQPRQKKKAVRPSSKKRAHEAAVWQALKNLQKAFPA